MRTDKKPTPFGRAVRMRLAALDMDQKALANNPCVYQHHHI